MKPLRIAAIVLCVVSALSLLLCLFTADNDALFQRRHRQCGRPLRRKAASERRSP